MIAIDWSKMTTAQALEEQASRLAAEEQARHLLAATDWMVARMAETGAEMPEEVRRQRARARKLLSGEA